MLARIVKINDKTVVIKNNKGSFITVPKSELEFDYKLGDTIEIEKNGAEYYFLPKSEKVESTDIDLFYNDGLFDEEEPVQKKKTPANNKKLSGIGGWLVVYIITAILSIIVSIAGITNNTLSSSDCALLNKNFHNFCADATPFMTFEIIMIIVLSILRLLTIILIFQKKKSAIRYTKAIIGATLIWNIIDFIMAISIFGNSKYGLPSSFTSDQSTQLMRPTITAAIYAFVWIPYFSNSVRVANTLTEETESIKI